MTGTVAIGQSALLRKVTKSVTNDLLGSTDDNKPDSNQPEPACANDQAELVFDLGGELKIDYREFTVSVLDDGRILGKLQGSDDSYISKDGVVQGPYKSGDPKLADFEAPKDDDKSVESLIAKNKPYISRSGEKLLITFDGKKYGPYAEIHDFIVTKSKNKFVSTVTENAFELTNLTDKADEALKNAKSDQEKMAIAMQYASQLGAIDLNPPMPTLVTNIPDASYDINQPEGSLNGNINYDDIMIVANDKIINMQGKTLLTLKPEAVGSNKELFINSTYTKYAYYQYGALTFSDNTSLTDLFKPHLVKEDGKVYLAYMYYSPKKNSIMQWKIPF